MRTDSNRFLFVDRSELVEGGQPVTVSDEHGRILFRGTTYVIPGGAKMVFDPESGVPLADAGAKLWVEWKE